MLLRVVGQDFERRVVEAAEQELEVERLVSALQAAYRGRRTRHEMHAAAAPPAAAEEREDDSPERAGALDSLLDFE